MRHTGNRLRTGVVLVVVSAWAANMVVPIFVDDFQSSPELNVAFMAITGLLTAEYSKPPDDEAR